jgi:hypothetical protein
MSKIRRLILALTLVASLVITVTVFAESLNFNTHLSAANEVMPPGIVNNSLAQGQALFNLSEDGTTLHYKLIAANIDNAFMAHIHMGPVGVNAPVVVWLFPSTKPGVTGPVNAGRMDGVLAEGDITAADLVGPLKGHPFSELLDAIRSGNAYVNIHTTVGGTSPNTGPGNFPGGEIRGQLGMHQHD